MLKEGDKAPSISLPDADGEIVSIADFKDKYVVVYFYPKDNTPGCTREAQAFSAAAPSFSRTGAKIFGISKDSTKSHCSFRDKYDLKISLLSDTDLAVHNAFGAYGEKMMYGKKVMGTIRSTFIVAPGGRIARVFPKVSVDGHAEAVLLAIKELKASA